ncbi:NAD-dependent protein deacetylase srt2 [Orobanche minor]
MFKAIHQTRNGETLRRPRFISSHGSVKLVPKTYSIRPSGTSMENKEIPSNFLKDKKMVPNSDPPSAEDIDLLYQFFDRSSKLVILTGAGVSTESGIPDYRRLLHIGTRVKIPGNDGRDSWTEIGCGGRNHGYRSRGNRCLERGDTDSVGSVKEEMLTMFKLFEQIFKSQEELIKTGKTKAALALSPQVGEYRETGSSSYNSGPRNLKSIANKKGKKKLIDVDDEVEYTSDEEEEAEFMIEQAREALLNVLNKQQGSPGYIDVLLKWKDWPDYEATWEDFTMIQHQFPNFHLEDKPKWSLQYWFPADYSSGCTPKCSSDDYSLEMHPFLVYRLHHRAGSSPLELHGTVYVVACMDCGFSLPRNSFQDQVKAFNPKWAEAIENLDYDSRSDKSFGMKQRPDGDIEIDEKFWEEEFDIPNCQRCNGILKPDVVFFGDNVPMGRAHRAMEAAKECDAFLVLGSSLMTMSAFRLIRAAHEAGAATAVVNVGVTRADDFVPLKINSRLGEILPRLLSVGSLSVPVEWST